MILDVLTVMFKTNCTQDPECDAMRDWLEAAMVRAANTVARDCAVHFGYEVTSEVEN